MLQSKFRVGILLGRYEKNNLLFNFFFSYTGEGWRVNVHFFLLFNTFSVIAIINFETILLLTLKKLS